MDNEKRWKIKIPVATFADSVIPEMVRMAKTNRRPTVAIIIGN